MKLVLEIIGHISVSLLSCIPNDVPAKPVHAINKQHKCPICDFSCSLQDSLIIHIESVHGKKKPHKCSICDYSCSQKADLKIHIESVHEKKKPHKCSI